jgi:hypothetical protein
VSDWKEALAPTPECIDVARLGEELTAEEREHVDACVRCRSELALFREVTSEESSPESQWIAEELQRRSGGQAILPVRDRRDRLSSTFYAIAAALALVIGIGAWMQVREASIDVPMGPGMYRSVQVEVIAPVGAITRPPNELRWKPVPQASRYHVQILEVDATHVWSTSTTDTHVVLPPDVVARFAPGKLLLWDVTAYRGNEELATSETQNVRVTP